MGSAGTYSILQPPLSRPMLCAKVDVLEAGHSDIIAIANVGCYAYLRHEARVPVVHWSSSWYDRRGLAFLTMTPARLLRRRSQKGGGGECGLDYLVWTGIPGRADWRETARGTGGGDGGRVGPRACGR